jgi:hypothetical protein
MYTTILTYSLRGRFDDDESTRARDLFCRVVGYIVVLFDATSPISLAMMLEEQREKITSTLKCLHSVRDVPEGESRLIRLLHPSFRDCLLDPYPDCRRHPPLLCTFNLLL